MQYLINSTTGKTSLPSRKWNKKRFEVRGKRHFKNTRNRAFLREIGTTKEPIITIRRGQLTVLAYITKENKTKWKGINEKHDFSEMIYLRHPKDHLFSYHPGFEIDVATFSAGENGKRGQNESKKSVVIK